MRNTLTTRLLGLGLLLSIDLVSLPADARPALERGDSLWARRAEGQVDAVARPEPIRAAIADYRAAIEAEPGMLAAHWRLQRALWFAADFATSDPDEKRALHERAIEASEAAFAVLAERVGGSAALAEATPESLRDLVAPDDRSDAAQLYFWSAINLGAWSRLAGLLSAVRAGVANRLHEATLRSIALDPSIELGGAIRLLSRLHSELPRVPLLSSWVDHARAVPLAERAVADYPAHPGNDFLLALALLANVPERRDEALAILERTANLEPRPAQFVEDFSMRRSARELLQTELRDSSASRSPS